MDSCDDFWRRRKKLKEEAIGPLPRSTAREARHWPAWQRQPLRGTLCALSVDPFYRDHFIGQWPSDTTITPISRTAGNDQIVDEMLITFTHDRVIDCILPGVAPTGRKIEVPTVAIVRFEGGKVAHEHIYWDQASVLVQAGLIDPEGLPIAGAEVAAKVEAPTLPSNTLIRTRTKAS